MHRGMNGGSPPKPPVPLDGLRVILVSDLVVSKQDKLKGTCGVHVLVYGNTVREFALKMAYRFGLSVSSHSGFPIIKMKGVNVDLEKPTSIFQDKEEVVWMAELIHSTIVHLLPLRFTAPKLNKFNNNDYIDFYGDSEEFVVIVASSNGLKRFLEKIQKKTELAKIDLENKEVDSKTSAKREP